MPEATMLRPVLHLDLAPVGEELPPLAALFLIHFDTKKGYTIEWQRAADGVDLDGVEFSSLPSGLHNLEEDLVYFVHGPYAGLSAFVNVSAGEEERGALMVSAGVLVPLSYGRLGRSWRHAESLKALARQYTTDTSSHKPFEDYYNLHKIQDVAPTDPLVTPGIDPLHPTSRRSSYSHSHVRTHSVSDSGTFLVPGQTLSQSHPAFSLGSFMNTFGPLAFPIYRAALARKRILLVTHAPVEAACNFVYDISILSNIPYSITDLLPCNPSRLKPLFNVGVHDIPLLEEEARIRAEGKEGGKHGAWVACTTDEVLGIKTKLWDVIVRLPPPHSAHAKEKVWPAAETNAGQSVKATQRDLRRFRALTKSLDNRYRPRPANEDAEDADVEEPGNIEEVCEKLTWREIAYSSFIWWASAGEQLRSDAEAEDGRLLLDTHFAYTPTMQDYSQSYRDEQETEGGETEDGAAEEAITSSSSPVPSARRRSRRRSVQMRRRSTNLRTEGVGSEEMDIIAYFHQMTQKVFTVLADAAACAGGEESGEEGEEERGLIRNSEVRVSLDDVERMGLDRYSDLDVVLVKEVVGRWWGRTAEVERWRVSCCGVECG